MRKIVAANWKLNKSPSEARSFCQDYLLAVKSPQGSALRQAINSQKLSLLVFPQALSADAFAEEIHGSGVEWGVQNFYIEDQGAFTGENSLLVACEMGAKWALVGHSERRSLFKEASSLLQKKIELAWRHGVTPLLCIGETEAERDQGKTLHVLEQQILGVLKSWREAPFLGQQLGDWKSTNGSHFPLVVAYEPVWAIGTGKVASPDQVQECHLAISHIIRDLGLPELNLLYGGSVKAENAGELSRLEHVDGFLVGGASLKVSSFLEIAKASYSIL
jgi:triosephosphate isomerase